MNSINPKPRFLTIRPSGIHLISSLLISSFLIFATFGAYWQVQNHAFVHLDDDLYILDNPYIKQGLTVQGVLWSLKTVHFGHWHPVTWFSHMLDAGWFGLNPGGHHLTNLLFHVVNTLLLFFLLLRMTGTPWQGGFVAALFALHPLHVESVAWIAERKDLLSLFFSMLALWAYVYYVEKPKILRYAWIILFLALALMAKPMAVTLPFVLLLLDYWPLNRFPGKKIRLLYEKIPLFFLAGALSLFTFLAHERGGALASFHRLPLDLRIGNALVSYLNYMIKMIWPDPLAVLYPHPLALSYWEVAGAATVLTMLTFLAIVTSRNHPYSIVGWLWYLGTLVPVIGFVQAGPQAMADRFTYFPLIGLFIIIAYGIPDVIGERVKLPYRKAVLAALGILALSVLMIVTRSQVRHWQDSTSLFEHTLNVTRNNHIIHNNLGVTFLRQGKNKEAHVQLTKALEINPGYVDAHCNLATLMARQGKKQEAKARLEQALRISPDKAEAHHLLGIFLFEEGKNQEAMGHFRQAVHHNPHLGEAFMNLGIVLLKEGKNQEALFSFQKALQINPTDARVHNNLGTGLTRMGRIPEAIHHYLQALKADPRNAEAHFNLAAILMVQGKDQEAIAQYEQVLRISPSDAEAHYRLGTLLARQKKNHEAQSHLVKAVQITPGHGEARFLLGTIYLDLGKKDLAMEQYRILRSIDAKQAEALDREIKKHGSS